MLASLTVNTLVSLHSAGWDAPLSSRVEDVVDPDIVVSAPAVPPGYRETRVADQVLVAWRGPRGPQEVPTTLHDREGGTVPRWRLRPTGPVVTTQRREHVRGGVALSATLDLGDHRVAAPATDLSEGGIRLLVPASVRVAVGDHVDVTFAVNGQWLESRACVVRLQRVAGGVEAGCTFVGLARHDADRVRRFIFQRQVRALAWERQ